MAGSLLRVPQADSKVTVGLNHILGALGRNLLLSAFRMLAEFSSLWVEHRGLVSLLAITQRLSEQFRAVGISSHMAPPLQTTKAHQIPFVL